MRRARRWGLLAASWLCAPGGAALAQTATEAERTREEALFGAPADARPGTAGAPGQPAAGAAGQPATPAQTSKPGQSSPPGPPSGAGQPPAPGSPTEAGASGAAAPGERPSEEALFGGDPEPAPTPAPGELREAPAGAPESPREERDEAALLSPESPTRTAFETGEVEEDPLQIGGQFYLRAVTRFQDPGPPREAPFFFPTLLDGYFDARPNDRLRGMVVTRFAYDPAQAAAPSPLTPTATVAKNPRLELDQLWLRFDIARKVFVTAGKQHVKWGASRFWNPTDFLSAQRRDPLAVFDARLGTNMVKFHVPWEERSWNFYALALIDNYGPASTLGQVGGAARAEVVLGATEIGLDAVARQGIKPRYGLDFSSGVGPFDVYGEIALRRGTDRPVWRLRPLGETVERLDEFFTEEEAFDAFFEAYQPQGANASASGGFTYSFNYSEADTATVGAEYFYNRYGYTHPAVLVPQLLRGGFMPFYSGRHYLGLYALAAAPGSWENTTFALTNLMNLSDSSGVARVDSAWRVLSYLTVESYAQAHYGGPGEFRLGATIPARTDRMGTPEDPSDDVELPAVVIPYPVLELGLGLRVNL